MNRDSDITQTIQQDKQSATKTASYNAIKSQIANYVEVIKKDTTLEAKKRTKLLHNIELFEKTIDKDPLKWREALSSRMKNYKHNPLSNKKTSHFYQFLTLLDSSQASTTQSAQEPTSTTSSEEFIKSPSSHHLEALHTSTINSSPRNTSYSASENRLSGIVETMIEDLEAMKSLVSNDTASIASETMEVQAIPLAEPTVTHDDTPPRQNEDTIETPTRPMITEFYSHHLNNRFHLFAARADANAHYNILNNDDKALTGDALKATILQRFTDRLQQRAATRAELENSQEYQLLSKGQGLFTRLFKLKTDSVKAFEDISVRLGA